MNKVTTYLQKHWWGFLLGALIAALIGGLFLYRLGSLVGGISKSENTTALTPLGWHGIYQHPLYLPLDFIRSIVFKLSPHYGQTLLRLPNVLFGVLSIVTMSWLIKIWHGTRIALFATLMFACSSWVLHTSRYASFDVMYLWSLPTLLVTYAVIHRYAKRQVIIYIALFIRSLLLFTPGLIWFALIVCWWQRADLLRLWNHFNRWWQRAIMILLSLYWLPLLLHYFLQSGSNIRSWLGLPSKFATPQILAKQTAAVGVHLFIRGPEYPTIWLGRAPILDVFTLALTFLGIYFYIRHWQASRSRILASFFIVGIILIGLGGPVSLSLLIPVCYFLSASGLAYLLHKWLKVFPLNPIARSFGVSLVAIGVLVSCSYNLQAYFIAWPHNDVTQSSFRLKR